MSGSTLAWDYSQLLARHQAMGRELAVLREENASLHKQIKTRHDMILARDARISEQQTTIRRLEKSRRPRGTPANCLQV